MGNGEKDEKERDKKLNAVKLAIDQIQKQYGRGSIMRLGQQTSKIDPTNVIPTGSLALDLALGVGGVPRGRIVEIFGPESSGKTTVALSVVAQAQKKGGFAAFVDAEHALDPVWAETIGVNLDDLLISQPDTGEQALEITETLIRSGGIDVVVVDSVAALVPRSEIEGDMGDAQVGVQARLMSQALRKLTGVISKSRTTAMFTNQIRHKIGVMFGNPETTPGGLALKFYSSVRMDIRKIKTLKNANEVTGSRHRVKIVKNKIAPPFKQGEFEINARGIDKLGELVDIGTDIGIINRTGAFYKYKGNVIGQGRDAAVSALKEDKKLASEILSQIWAKVKGEKGKNKSEKNS